MDKTSKSALLWWLDCSKYSGCRIFDNNTGGNIDVISCVLVIQICKYDPVLHLYIFYLEQVWNKYYIVCFKKSCHDTNIKYWKPNAWSFLNMCYVATTPQWAITNSTMGMYQDNRHPHITVPFLKELFISDCLILNFKNFNSVKQVNLNSWICIYS